MHQPVLPKDPIPTVSDTLPSTQRSFSLSLDDSEYLLVYNRPKQYYGSLYEPDKQSVPELVRESTLAMIFVLNP